MESRILRRSVAIGMVLCSLLALSVPKAAGQATTGSIVGTVTDASGAVVPGAEVTVTNTATGQSEVVKTDSAGYYNVEALVPSSYNVVVQKEGFTTQTIQDVRVDPSARVAVNAVLAVGSAVTKVSVAASSVRVETESGASSGVISGNQVNQIELNGRNYVQLSVLVPGVVSTAGLTEAVSGGLTYSTNISVNGGDQQLNNTSVDGTYNMNTGAFGSLNVVTPLDSISEFNILKDNYSAKYGVSGSAQIQVDTKSGTQQFHGSAYDYLRSQALDASNFFAAGSKTPLKQNNFGFSLGGPLYIPGHYNKNKTKTFFFVNEEWHVRHVGDTLRGAVFTPAMRGGDLSASPTLHAGGLQSDSASAALLAQAHPGVNCVPTPTTLNTACFDPNAVLLMNKFWPEPNNPGGGFLNYINPGIEAFNQRDDNYRIDHYINDRNRIMARFSYEPVTDAYPAATWGVNPTTTTTQQINQTGFNALIRYSAKEQLSSGRLGRVLSIYTRRNRPKWQAAIYKRTPIVLETAIHDIDTMLWYTGKKVKSVRGYDIAVEPGKGADLTWAVLRFEDGALGVLETTWLLPDKTPFLDDFLQVVATSGVANIDILNSGLTIWCDDGADVPDACYEPRLRGSAYGALREELSYFSLCALEGRKPTMVSAEDGVEALRVGLAVVESARADREVEVASIS